MQSLRFSFAEQFKLDIVGDFTLAAQLNKPGQTIPRLGGRQLARMLHAPRNEILLYVRP
jgi:hypothetical protein